MSQRKPLSPPPLPDPMTPEGAAALRHAAEAVFHEQGQGRPRVRKGAGRGAVQGRGQGTGQGTGQSKGQEAEMVTDEARLIEDLHIHQIELELQNQSLRATRLQLEESLKRYAALYGFAPIALLTLTGNGTIHEVNQTAADLLGQPLSALRGRRLGLFVSKATRAAFNDLLTCALLGESDNRRELVLIPPDQPSRWVQAEGITAIAIATAIPDPKPLIQLALTDISASKALEECMREKEELFRAILDNASDGISYQDLKTQGYRFMNPALVDMSGFTAEEIKGFTVQQIFDRVHPDDRGRVDAQRRRLAQGREPESIQYRWRVKQGDYRWLIDTGKLVHDGRGRPVGLVNVRRDITRLKLYDLEINALNARLEQRVAERTAELEAKIADLRRMADRLSESESRFRALNEVLEQKVAERTAEARAASAAKSDFLAHMSHEIRTPLNAILGLAQLLERGSLDETQRQQVTRLQEAGDNLLAILSDILDFSKIESGRFAIETQPFDLKDVLGRIDSFLGRLARAKGLSLRIDCPTLPAGVLMGDPMRLGQVLTNLIGNAIKFTPAGEVSLSIEVQKAGGAHETGEIQEIGEPQEIGEAQETIEAQRTRTVRETAPGILCLRFVITDTGIGIEPQVLAGLFQPFIQGDASITRRFGGTGLGLVISKRLVETMGGEIGATSQPGQGSTFWFALPFTLACQELAGGVAAPEVTAPGMVATGGAALGGAARSDAAPGGATQNMAVPGAAAPGGAALGGATLGEAPPMALTTDQRLAGWHLLVVDDSEMNREVVEQALHLEGAEVTLACDGAEALEWLRCDPQAYRLVLMDVQMPVMDGLTATRRIRCELGLNDLPLIALTAGALPHEREAALAAGMNDVLTKPVRLEAMMATILRHGETAGQAGRQAEAFPVIAGIDREQATEILCGNRTLFVRLLALFLAQNDGLVKRVREELAQGQGETAANQLHKLKGNAGSLGAMAIMALASQLEKAIDGGETDLDANLTELDHQLQDLCLASAPWLGAVPPKL